MEKIKCELCGEEFDNSDLMYIEQFECIEENGRCVDCYEEYGDNYPDRI
jgi:hypothetical protein